jgi:hypothetical protein
MVVWMKPLIALLTFLGLALAAPVELKISLKNGSADLKLSEMQTAPNGVSYRIEVLRFYISEVALVKAGGSEVRFPGVFLADFKKDGPAQNVTIRRLDAPPGEYAGIRFAVGVPRELNHLDAAKQKPPLGIETGMFWSWNSGYIFYKLEGRFMKEGKPSAFLLHLGTSSFTQQVNLTDLMRGTTRIVVPAAGTSVRMGLDVNSAFSAGINGEVYDLNQAKYARVQGGPVAAQAFLNMLSAWSLEK